MKYIALLRGINVGGNSIIKMSDLKKVFEENGLESVSTYINSGNVLFQTEEKNQVKLEKILEEAVSKNFGVKNPIVVISYDELKTIVNEVPKNWKTNEDIRKYIAFVKKPYSASDVLKDTEIKEDIDFVTSGKGAVYWSTLLSGITKSKLSKISTKKIYKFVTIRNFNTVQKLLKLTED